MGMRMRSPLLRMRGHCSSLGVGEWRWCRCIELANSRGIADRSRCSDERYALRGSGLLRLEIRGVFSARVGLALAASVMPGFMVDTVAVLDFVGGGMSGWWLR